MALSKSVNFICAQRAVPCNVCEDEVPGEYYCIECKQTLCPQCEKSHKKVAATKNHNIVLRTQVGDIDTTSLSCADHGDQASFHCDKCNIPVCIRCVTGKHQGHNMADLDDILIKEKMILRGDIEAMQRAIQTLKNHRGELLTEKEKYKKQTKKILKDMEDENQAATKELQRLQKERVDETIAIQDSHMVIFDGFEQEMKSKIISYENRVSEYEDTITNNSLPAVYVAKGMSSLPGIGSKPKFPDPPTFVPGHFQSIVENLGKLNISASSIKSKQLKIATPTITSQFKCPLRGFPRICITKEGDVWLGGFESRELVMVDIKGQVLRRRKIPNRPTALAVMEFGDIIISPHYADSRSVSILLREGGEQHLYDTPPSSSTGVSVTADQKILICTLDGRVVRINGDGTNEKEIYEGSGRNSVAHAIESADGNIYINEWATSAVIIVNKDGEVPSTITHTTERQQLGRPWGLVMDKMDNILCADTGNHCVYIIDQDHQMRELLGPSHGIESPQWLAVDNDNNLWITQYDGTVNVVKYLYQ